MSPQSATIPCSLGSATRKTRSSMIFPLPSIQSPFADPGQKQNSNDVWSLASVATCNFLEGDDIRNLWSLEDLAQDAVGAFDGREEKTSMFYDVRESLCMTWLWCVFRTRRNVCPLEGTKSTPRSNGWFLESDICGARDRSSRETHSKLFEIIHHRSVWIPCRILRAGFIADNPHTGGSGSEVECTREY